jgi:hypothetical protein
MIVILFLTRLQRLLIKRKKITFTLRHHFSEISRGNRRIHILTFSHISPLLGNIGHYFKSILIILGYKQLFSLSEQAENSSREWAILSF